MTYIDLKYFYEVWRIEHVLSRVKGETKRNGQRTVRVEIRLTTCRLALASMWKLVHMTFSPNVITKMCKCVTTQNWTCLPQTEKMRENWRTKREAGVRSALKCRLNKCGYEMTRIGTCLEIHTRDWHKATHPPTSFTSAWYGSTLEAPVPWDYSSHTGQGTQTQTYYKNNHFYWIQCNQCMRCMQPELVPECCIHYSGC